MACEISKIHGSPNRVNWLGLFFCFLAIHKKALLKCFLAEAIEKVEVIECLFRF